MSLFPNLGAQLKAIVAAGTYGNMNAVDPRLHEVERRASIAPAGGSEFVPSDGGFLIEPEFSRELVSRVYATGQLLRRMTKFTLTKSNALKLKVVNETSRATGSRLGGIQILKTNEAQALTYSQSPAGALSVKPQFGRHTITCDKYTGLMYVTDELDQETNALSTWASKCFVEEYSYALENDAVNGTGAGELLGVLNSPALITVPKVLSQTAATVNSANILAMLAQTWVSSLVNGTATWLYNSALLPSLGNLTTSVGTGGGALPLWTWRTADQDPDRLAGLPAFPSEYCSAPGTPGDLILCDWSRYAIVERETRAESSIHVAFLEDTNTLRWVWRVGGGTLDQVPITPANSSSPPVVTSTCLTLAART